MRKVAKKLVAVLVICIMLFSMATPALASPSANRATRADLEVIVRNYVERHVDQFLGSGSAMDNTVAAFEAFVADLALSTIRNVLLDAEGLVDFTAPLISAMLNEVLNSALAQVSHSIPDVDVSDVVDRVLRTIADSGIIEYILSIQLVEDILERAVEYAVADAIDLAMSQIVFIPADADVTELTRRYANEIAGFNVVPFPLTHAFLNTSLSNQGLLLGHSLDLVNPFWAIEVHSHGFLNLQRTYRVTGWQRSVNTSSIEVLVNLIPGVNLNVNDFLSIENYVLARLGVDVIGGTYDGITNFDVDAFLAELPAIIWAATQRAAVDVVTERIEAAIDYVVDLVEYELGKIRDLVQSEIDGLVFTIETALRNAVNAVLPVHASVQECFANLMALVEASIALYFSTEAQVRSAIVRLESVINRVTRSPFSSLRAQTIPLLDDMLEQLELREDEIIADVLAQKDLSQWFAVIAGLNTVFDTDFTVNMTADDVLAELADILNQAALGVPVA